MCNRLGPFKLCTCSDNIDYSKPHWFLYNDDRINNMFKDVGIIRGPSLNEKLEAKNIEHKLNNNRDVFDFDYKPKENDCIEFVLSEERGYSFTFRNGKWIEEMSFYAFDGENQNIKLKGIFQCGSSI